MTFQSIEEVAPHVVKGTKIALHLDDFTPNTGVAKHRGCFVRWRLKSTSAPVLDTIKLTANAGWNPVEAVSGDGNYNNKPFGIIDSYPAKVNDIDGGGVYGKLTVHVLGNEVPVLVAFRYIDDNGVITEPSINLIGKKVWVYGKDVNIQGTTYVVAVVSDISVPSMPSFIVDKIVRPLPLVNSMSTQPRDVGWLVVALDSGFVSDGAIAPP
jgi:hypothetical protein